MNTTFKNTFTFRYGSKIFESCTDRAVFVRIYDRGSSQSLPAVGEVYKMVIAESNSSELLDGGTLKYLFLFEKHGGKAVPVFRSSVLGRLSETPWENVLHVITVSSDFFLEILPDDYV